MVLVNLLLVMLPAYIVAYLTINNTAPWKAILAYWIIVFLKNAYEYGNK